MRFGMILNGGNGAEQPGDEAMADLRAKARTAQRRGLHPRHCVGGGGPA